MAANTQYSYTHLTSGTTTINKGKPTILAGVWVNKALSGTVTISDGASTVAILTNGTTAPLGAVLTAGNGGLSLQSLIVALSGTEDITIIWS